MASSASASAALASDERVPNLRRGSAAESSESFSNRASSGADACFSNPGFVFSSTDAFFSIALVPDMPSFAAAHDVLSGMIGDRSKKDPSDLSGMIGSENILKKTFRTMI